MRKPIRNLVLAGGLFAGLAGCQCGQCVQFVHYSDKMLNAPGERASETDAPYVSNDMANSAQFRGVPLQVQHAFSLDYDGAAVTSVHLVPTGTGGTFYKIDYIENGTPGQAVYHADGSTAAANHGVVVLPDPSEVPIAPLPAEPATQPAAATVKDFQ